VVEVDVADVADDEVDEEDLANIRGSSLSRCWCASHDRGGEIFGE